MISKNFDAQSLEIPEEIFQALKNVVFTEDEKVEVQFYQTVEMMYNYNTAGKRVAPYSGIVTKAKLATPKKGLKGMYGLNMIHNMIHEFDYKYEGLGENGEFIFYKPEINFTYNNVNYHIDAESFILYKKDNKWHKEFTTITKFKYNGKEYSYADVAKMLNITTEELEQKIYYKEIGEERDPNKYITSIIPYIEYNSGGVFLNKTMINGNDWNGYPTSGKITSYGQTWPGFIFRWKYFGSVSQGAYGTTWIADRIDKSDIKALSITLVDNGLPETYNTSTNVGIIDLDLKFSTLEIQLELLPAQGKSESAEGYMNIQGTNVIQRLPRKPVS